MPRALFAFALFCAACAAVVGASVASSTRPVEVVWQAPAKYAGPADDCATAGGSISQEDLASLTYQVRWRIGQEQPYQYATTTSTRYVLQAVPVGATLNVSVGAYLPGGEVKCWSDEASIVVPPQAVGGCRNVRITVK